MPKVNQDKVAILSPWGNNCALNSIAMFCADRIMTDAKADVKAEINVNQLCRMVGEYYKVENLILADLKQLLGEYRHPIFWQIILGEVFESQADIKRDENDYFDDSVYDILGRQLHFKTEVYGDAANVQLDEHGKQKPENGTYQLELRATHNPSLSPTLYSYNTFRIDPTDSAKKRVLLNSLHFNMLLEDTTRVKWINKNSGKETAKNFSIGASASEKSGRALQIKMSLENIQAARISNAESKVSESNKISANDIHVARQYFDNAEPLLIIPKLNPPQNITFCFKDEKAAAAAMEKLAANKKELQILSAPVTQLKNNITIATAPYQLIGIIDILVALNKTPVHKQQLTPPPKQQSGPLPSASTPLLNKHKTASSSDEKIKDKKEEAVDDGLGGIEIKEISPPPSPTSASASSAASASAVASAASASDPLLPSLDLLSDTSAPIPPLSPLPIPEPVPVPIPVPPPVPVPIPAPVPIPVPAPPPPPPIPVPVPAPVPIPVPAPPPPPPAYIAPIQQMNNHMIFWQEQQQTELKKQAMQWQQFRTKPTDDPKTKNILDKIDVFLTKYEGNKNWYIQHVVITKLRNKITADGSRNILKCLQQIKQQYKDEEWNQIISTKNPFCKYNAAGDLIAEIENTYGTPIGSLRYTK